MEFLTDIIHPGDTVLFKASRLLQFEQIIERFKQALMNRELAAGSTVRAK